MHEYDTTLSRGTRIGTGLAGTGFYPLGHPGRLDGYGGFFAYRRELARELDAYAGADTDAGAGDGRDLRPDHRPSLSRLRESRSYRRARLLRGLGRVPAGCDSRGSAAEAVIVSATVIPASVGALIVLLDELDPMGLAYKVLAVFQGLA